MTALVAPRWRRVLPWASASALAVGLAAVLAALGAVADAVTAGAAAGDRRARRRCLAGHHGRSAQARWGNAAVVSPDGTQLAFVAQPHGGGAPRLYVRRLDQLTATPLAGTEGAVGPFFSPDGQWLGFFGGGKLKKIAVTGGAPVTLADAPTARGGSWAEDGTIVFTPNDVERPLARVGGGRDGRAADDAGPRGSDAPVAAGAARRPGRPLHGERREGNFTNAWLAVQPLPTGTPHIVQRGGFYGRYLPSGHLTWVHDGTLFAAPFDLTTLAVTGPAVPVVPGVLSSTISGNAQVDVSHTRHARVPSGRRDRIGGPARLADPRRQNDAAQGHAGQLERRADRPGRPPARLLAHGRGEHGRVDVRCGARRADEVAVDPGTIAIRSGRRMGGGWSTPRRGSGGAEPLLAAGGWQRGRHAADDKPEHTVSGVVAPERPLPGVLRNPAADGRPI